MTAICAVLFTACNPSNPAENVGDGINCPKDVEIALTGGSQTVTIHADANWKAAPSETWITVSPTKGYEGDNDVKVTVQAGKAAEGYVLFRCQTGGEAKMKVYRGEKPSEDPEDPEDPDTPSGHHSNIGDGISVRFRELPFTADGGSFTVLLKSSSKWTATTDKKWLSVNRKSGDGSCEVRIEVNEYAEKDEGWVTFKNQTGIAEVKITRSGKLYHEDSPEMDYSRMKKPSRIDGCSQGLFPISMDELVYISRADLQYHPRVEIWRFAPHPYDRNPPGNDKDTWPEPEDYIDLFAWGTSGWSGGITAYQPTSFAWQEKYEEYWIAGDPKKNMEGAYANADWGVYNKISNGGNAAGQWRTPTYEEWQFICTRRPGWFQLQGAATVADVAGVVLLPNNWQMPDGLPKFKPIAAPFGGEYDDNVYDKGQWEKMEAAGAVFFARREVSGNWPHAEYWSSTVSEDFTFDKWHDAHTILFDKDGGSPGAQQPRNQRCNVRLIHD